MSGDSIPTETVTRKPDEDVGKPGGPAAGGGKQTAQQAEITRQGSGGRSEAEEHASWSKGGGEPGRNPAPIGGSSNGHSDQKAAQGPREDEPVAAGHYKVERGNS
ncbi:MAG: hypothetical protein K2Y56_07165 [Methylobacterium sp.]|uniref:hypothetical protein n=1 Tax=Methylobacterium sp. TaxID=409 RepID=UPI0025D0B877|nr:hypothetical protein [Methylobacterium sp.]MBX9931303.1 hypothetical protein [Methylobacterium sp.]